MSKKKYKIYDPNTIRVVKKGDQTVGIQKIEKTNEAPKSNSVVKHTFGDSDTQRAKKEQIIRSQSLALIRKKYQMVSDQDLKLESRLLIFNKRLKEFPVKNIVTVIKALLKDK